MGTNVRMAITAGRTQLLLGDFPTQARTNMTPAQAKHTEKKARRRLLVIDADVQDRAMLQDALEAEACEIVFWSSLEQLEKSLLDDPPFDAILIELLNPVEIFYKLISAIKARFPHTEVIFISRFADEHLWIELIQLGAYDLLPKPLERRELQRTVINALARNRSG